MLICNLTNIVKEYTGGEKVIPLNKVSLTVNSGDFITIEGPSGMGKSTLLYILGGLLKPTSGTIALLGKELSSLTDNTITGLREKNIGYIFQETILFQALTVRENIILPLSINREQTHAAKAEAIRYADFLLKQLGLSDRKDFLPYQLSVGQRRRAIIARALSKKPKLILADEPTNDLDEKWCHYIIQLLKEATANNSAVVMVTHNSKWTQQATKKYELKNSFLTSKVC